MYSFTQRRAKVAKDHKGNAVSLVGFFLSDRTRGREGLLMNYSPLPKSQELWGCEIFTEALTLRNPMEGSSPSGQGFEPGDNVEQFFVDAALSQAMKFTLKDFQ